MFLRIQDFKAFQKPVLELLALSKTFTYKAKKFVQNVKYITIFKLTPQKCFPTLFMYNIG